VGHIPGVVLRSTKPLLSGKVKLAAKGRQVVIYDQDGRLKSLTLTGSVWLLVGRKQ
jgi:hypothetical protein